MFATALGSVSASSFLSQIASIGASYAPSTSTSFSLVLPRPLSQSSSGVLHTLSPPPESVRRARVSSTFITSFFNCEGVSLLLMR
ncbi:pheophytinase [Cucumis melo var. makuwa]|uniref:Pheophytinase n=1 Tax=Cucumis melo var. makuwa TaxID=1194695 RepID=A0A5D3BUB2_CUCMM|nr:pheophytinase [Cucumis melo var. makuwa]TYK02392.1 pheophytinase [Cucumis melo var. makuwa]